MFSKKSPYEKLESRFWEFVNNYSEDGLENILSNLDNPQKLGYTEEFVDNHIFSPVCMATAHRNIRREVFSDNYTNFLKYIYGVRLRTIAAQILPTKIAGWGMIIAILENLPQGWPFTKITHDEFESIYLLLERLYFVQSNHKLGADDLLDIYFSGLDERLVFFLDEFDIVSDEDIPEPSKEYFKTLKHVKYQDSTVKSMHRDLGYLVSYSIRYYLSGRLGGWEGDILKTLTYCSAVSDGRKIIIRDDVVRAFNAYFKLLNTDITKYKARKDIVNSADYNSFRAKLMYYSLRLTHGLTP
ncbi:hypothetical protein BK008_04555 [Methanobacterium sp. MZ-A1]|uniref:hypothetical protein n=1 Tax=Methanobacterium sp. MZ-A1 TaxID=1911685 RepID=UPI000C2D44C0|nr:hypothetical protein [Methanobacterium sp. MZ-A1]AUB57652.1 hypothetical protein BK008_04555 [Methanobacterium sp. MZ-A1]